MPGIVALGAVAALAYFAAVDVPRHRAAIEADWRQRLVDRAEIRHLAVEAWFRRESEAAAGVAAFPVIADLLAGRDAAGHAEAVLRRSLVSEGIVAAVLLDAGGRAPLTVPRAGPAADPAVLAAARAMARPGAGPADVVPSSGGRALVLTAAAVPGGGGTVVLVHDPERWLYPFLRSAQPSGSLEALLVRVRGDSVEFLSPRLSGAEVFRRVARSARLAAAWATTTAPLFGHWTDYRDAPVLAATVAIEGTPFGLVVKVDRAEAFAAFRRNIVREAAAWTAVVGAVSGLVLVLWWGLRLASSSAAARDRARFASLLDHASDAILIMDQGGAVLDCNAVAEDVTGLSRAELLRCNAVADLLPPGERERAALLLASVFTGSTAIARTVLASRSGRLVPLEVSARPAVRDGVPVAVTVARDISERRAAQARERRLNAILQTLTEVAQLIVREPDRGRLLQRACEIMVEHGGFRLAWIGDAGVDGTLRPEARAGATAFLDGLSLRWDDGPTAECPAARAVRERRVVVAELGHEPGSSVWREHAVAAGIAATAAAPLLLDGELWGVLSLSVTAEDVFDAGAIALVEQLAGDLAFALRARHQSRALSESEERLRAFFSSGVIGILFGDIQGGIEDANDEFLRIVGRGRDALQGGGLRWSELTPERWVEADAEGITEARARGACTPYEKEYRRPDGSLVPILVGYVLLPPERERSVAFVMDLTRIKASEAAAARGAAALHQAAEAVIITDPTGAIVDVNPAFEAITGYGRDEVLGQNPRLLKSGRQDEAFYQRMWRILGSGEVWRGEVVNRRKDGVEYTAEVSISPIRDDAGRVVNYVGVQRDVTRERELDQRLHQAQRAEALGQLTGGIAHDFNNLLTVILSNLNLAESDLPPEGAGVRPYLKDLGEAARHGSALVRKLLAFGRRSRLTLEPADLGELADQAARLLRRVIPEHIEIRWTRPAEPAPALVDVGAVEQMLLNLATNARDAMPDGGALTLGVEATTVEPDEAASAGTGSPSGRYVALTVQDTGTGMSSEVLAHAFEPFFTTKQVGQGTGLGLSMIFGLMRQHRGLVRLKSRLGEGTVFQLCFPAAERDALAGVRVAAQPAGRVTGGTETILVVEDEPALRAAAQRSLTRLGYRVLTAENGIEGWAVFQAEAQRIALVVSDAVMPKLGGLALHARIREARSTVPFLLSSGYADGIPGQEQTDAADVPLLPKPWTPAELGARVRQMLDGNGHGAGRSARA